MPELIEVETYRRQAESTVGRVIASVPQLDPIGLRSLEPSDAIAMVVGCRVTGTERIGKLLLLETDGPVVGLRFGMTGRLLVDGHASITELQYGGSGDDPSWDRFVIRFDGGGDLRIRDPRRLGGLELDPDISRLGPDASDLTAHDLRSAVRGSRAPVKARLLDQSKVAGLGNLLVDESLWRAGLDPGRRCFELTDDELGRLAAVIVETVADLTARGGSHTGDLQAERRPGGCCPFEGAPLERLRVGGRTTYRCQVHQR